MNLALPDSAAPIPMVDVAAQHRRFAPAVEAAVARVLASGRYVGGPEVAGFETALAQWLGDTSPATVPPLEAVGTSSGTTALSTALAALDVGPGDEVIVPAFTFCATAEAALHVGATPRFVDVEAATLNLDPAAVEAAIRPRTRAIIAVHLHGRMADVRALRAIADRHDLALVEDAAQAFGANADGQLAGTVGDIGCFSFFPAKILGGAGDAGAAVGRRMDRLRRLVNHGRRDRERSDEPGFNHRIDALQAAILAVKLPHARALLDRREVLARRYYEALADRVSCLDLTPGQAHQAFCIHHPRRDELAHQLGDEGIASAVYYRYPLHRQRAFADLPRGPLPVSEAASATSLCLPLYPDMTDAQQERVIDAVLRFGP